MAKVMITETILRDAHQSQAATRMRLEEMLPACDVLDKAGYYSLECWGGATFDACLRFLNEDPWERLRQLKKALPNTRLQMLFRGQNILGYKHYADDVVDEFVRLSIKNGIDVIRIFDALNDPRNLAQAVKSTKKYGGICEMAMSYTVSPVHTEEYFVNLALEYEKMGADNICIKDMANLLLPYQAYSLVKKLKQALKPETLVHLHTHNTTGTGDMVNLKAIEAGCDIVDCALSEKLAGKPLEAVRQSFSELLRDAEINRRLLGEALNVIEQKLESEDSSDVVIGGGSNLLSYPEYSDVERAKSFLSVLESKDTIRKVVGRNGSMEVTIRIGPENGVPELKDCSIVTASYRAGDDASGTLVFICSPFSGNEQTNIENARRYCRFAVDRGYAPFAPHLFFPQFMDDAVSEERENGIFMGIIMLTKCAELWVFARSPGGGDRISKGMAQEIRKAESRSMPIRYFTTDCEEVEV